MYMEAADATDTSVCDTGDYSDGKNMFLADRHVFAVWPDAQGDGIALDPTDFPFVSSACIVPVIVPGATMRALGADPSLLNDISATHAYGWYSGLNDALAPRKPSS